MPTVSYGDAQDLLDTYKRGWEARDPDTVVDLFREDAEYRENPFTDQLVGANDIRAYWNNVAATQAHIEFEAERIWVAGTTVLASFHAAFTRRQNGDRVRLRGFMTFEIDDDGLVWRFRQWPLEQVVGKDSTFELEGEGS
jgi:ketosteroid isomerase-like protein